MSRKPLTGARLVRRETHRASAGPLKIEFDFTSPLAPFELIALLTWPTDPARRQVTLTAHAHQQFAAFMRENPLGQRDPRENDLLERELIERTGGWSYDSLPAWADEQALMLRHEERWRLTGAVLCFLRRQEVHHPQTELSLNRAAFIVDRYRETPGHIGALGTEPAMKSWSEWRTIAPLCAAAHLAWIDAQRRNLHPWPELCEPEVMRLLLGRAKWFRNWAISFRARRAKNFLLH
ncbi:MAG: hypothetical protein JWO24_4160, partial [Rhodospirillales bacterium]|nr:hypothetical protein [Rhodospirillales bacterium]